MTKCRSNSQRCFGADYNPFGMVMPGRNWTAGSACGYMFGYQGQQKNNDVYNNDNFIEFDERGYDPRTGRWWSVDPLSSKYSWHSPYLFTGNNPVLYKEVNGRDYALYINHDTHTIIIKATYYTVKGNADALQSATKATTFWNSQSGNYQYVVGKGDDAITYDIEFDLTVMEVDNPVEQANIDKRSDETNVLFNVTKVTLDGSSNTYEIKPDADPIFESTTENEIKLGVTIQGVLVNVKETEKKSDTGSHELGHTLGLGHFLKGILTSGSNDPGRSNEITPRYLKFIIGNAFKSNGKKYSKSNVIETGKSNNDFKKGKIVIKS